MKPEKPLWQMTRPLAATALGREPADLVVRDGRLVNVFTGEILDHTDIAVRGGRIALVGDARHTVGEHTQVIDAQGMFLTPGFLDGHLHVESSMTTVCEYAGCVVPHGTSGIFMDPHEIVNVLGLPGMRAMMADGAASPLRVYTTTPSCVPACPGLEDSGASVGPDDITETMGWEGVAALGEMMNYPGILGGDETVHEIVARALKAGRPVMGHFPSDDTGAALNAYIASGVSSCHESATAEQALAKMRLGMFAMIREGSAWHDLPEVIRAVTEHSVDTRMAVLVSDDLHADTLLERGHMDALLRMAVQNGVPPVTAIQMATLNTACCFHLDNEIGSLAPGRLADINLLGDLADMQVERVIIGGKTAAEHGRLAVPLHKYVYPDAFRHTIHIPRPLTPADFAVKAPAGASEFAANVIGVHAGDVRTVRQVMRLPVQNGRVAAQSGRDVIKVAVIDRHHGTVSMSVGFVAGFGITRGAAASTYAHDAHNLLIVGADDADMALAANRLAECGGGMAAVSAGNVLSLLELPVAGLMSERPAAEVAASLQDLARSWERLGCRMPSPFMTMSLLSLAVIPELRITNRGLVDVTASRLTSLAAEE